MRRTRWARLPAAILLSGACALRVASAAEAPVVADAFVSAAAAGVNAGALPTLNLAGTSTVLLQFSLAALPAGAQDADIVKATLLVYVSRVGLAGSVDISMVTSPWVENSVTFNTAPATASVPVAPIAVSAGRTVAGGGCDEHRQELGSQVPRRTAASRSRQPAIP